MTAPELLLRMADETNKWLHILILLQQLVQTTLIRQTIQTGMDMAHPINLSTFIIPHSHHILLI